MSAIPSHLSAQEKQTWELGLADADRYNILCHCRECDQEWVASNPVKCNACDSSNVEYVSCWQFPDD